MRPAAPERGAVSRNHPAGATGSAGMNAVLSEFNADACADAWHGDTAVPVRKTGSICFA
jgi:hypothetical protein